MEKLSRRKAIGAVAAAATATAVAASTKTANAHGIEGKVEHMSLDEFKSLRMSRSIESVMDKMNGGTFMYCHTKIAETTGIWIPELVPVFQKLDAQLIFSELPTGIEG